MRCEPSNALCFQAVCAGAVRATKWTPVDSHQFRESYCTRNACEPLHVTEKEAISCSQIFWEVHTILEFISLPDHRSNCKLSLKSNYFFNYLTAYCFVWLAGSHWRIHDPPGYVECAHILMTANNFCGMLWSDDFSCTCFALPFYHVDKLFTCFPYGENSISACALEGINGDL